MLRRPRTATAVSDQGRVAQDNPSHPFLGGGMITLPFDETLFNLLYNWEKAHLKRRLRPHDFHPWEEEIAALELAVWLINKIGEENIHQYFNAREEAEREIREEIKEEKEREGKRKREQAERKNTKKRLTYLMKNNRNGYFKIGRSANPKQREETLQAEDPDIELIATTNKDIEPLLHVQFAELRVRGEWFALSEEHVSKIRLLFAEETIQ